MTPNLPRAILETSYEEEARAYLRSLPLEHFMETPSQGTQREITLASLGQLRAFRPDVQVFNELLIQYHLRGKQKPEKVVPDNMLVLSTEPVRADLSFNVPLEAASPFWVLEYVSKKSKRKDYEVSFRKYERHLKVPYYLVFYADNQDLTLFRHNGRKYVTVKPNGHGRLPIPKLDLELGLLDGWVRFWYRGQLLPLAEDFQKELNATRKVTEQEKHRAEEERQRAEQEKHRAEEERQRAEQEKHRAEEERQRAEQEKHRAEKERQRADEYRQRLEALERKLAEKNSPGRSGQGRFGEG